MKRNHKAINPCQRSITLIELAVWTDIMFMNTTAKV